MTPVKQFVNAQYTLIYAVSLRIYNENIDGGVIKQNIDIKE